VRRNLWKHVKSCPFKPNTQAAAADGHQQFIDASDGLRRDILSVMHQDEVDDYHATLRNAVIGCNTFAS